MRLLVCGDRDYTNRRHVWDEISQEIEPHTRALANAVTIIHGAARGVDALASEYTVRWFWIEEAPYPADWTRYGKKAGWIRNQQMLEEGRPDRVLAFWTGKVKNSGTFDMICRAVNAGVPVRIVPVVRI